MQRKEGEFEWESELDQGSDRFISQVEELLCNDLQGLDVEHLITVLKEIRIQEQSVKREMRMNVVLSEEELIQRANELNRLQKAEEKLVEHLQGREIERSSHEAVLKTKPESFFLEAQGGDQEYDESLGPEDESERGTDEGWGFAGIRSHAATGGLVGSSDGGQFELSRRDGQASEKVNHKSENGRNYDKQISNGLVRARTPSDTRSGHVSHRQSKENSQQRVVQSQRVGQSDHHSDLNYNLSEAGSQSHHRKTSQGQASGHNGSAKNMPKEENVITKQELRLGKDLKPDVFKDLIRRGEDYYRKLPSGQLEMLEKNIDCLNKEENGQKVILKVVTLSHKQSETKKEDSPRVMRKSKTYEGRGNFGVWDPAHDTQNPQENNGSRHSDNQSHRRICSNQQSVQGPDENQTSQPGSKPLSQHKESAESRPELENENGGVTPMESNYDLNSRPAHLMGRSQNRVSEEFKMPFDSTPQEQVVPSRGTHTAEMSAQMNDSEFNKYESSEVQNGGTDNSKGNSLGGSGILSRAQTANGTSGFRKKKSIAEMIIESQKDLEHDSIPRYDQPDNEIQNGNQYHINEKQQNSNFQNHGNSQSNNQNLPFSSLQQGGDSKGSSSNKIYNNNNNQQSDTMSNKVINSKHSSHKLLGNQQDLQAYPIVNRDNIEPEMVMDENAEKTKPGFYNANKRPGSFEENEDDIIYSGGKDIQSNHNYSNSNGHQGIYSQQESQGQANSKHHSNIASLHGSGIPQQGHSQFGQNNEGYQNIRKSNTLPVYANGLIQGDPVSSNPNRANLQDLIRERNEPASGILSQNLNSLPTVFSNFINPNKQGQNQSESGLSGLGYRTVNTTQGRIMQNQQNLQNDYPGSEDRQIKLIGLDLNQNSMKSIQKFKQMVHQSAGDLNHLNPPNSFVPNNQSGLNNSQPPNNSRQFLRESNLERQGCQYVDSQVHIDSHVQLNSTVRSGREANYENGVSNGGQNLGASRGNFENGNFSNMKVSEQFQDSGYHQNQQNYEPNQNQNVMPEQNNDEVEPDIPYKGQEGTQGQGEGYQDHVFDSRPVDNTQRNWNHQRNDSVPGIDQGKQKNVNQSQLEHQEHTHKKSYNRSQQNKPDEINPQDQHSTNQAGNQDKNYQAKREPIPSKEMRLSHQTRIKVIPLSNRGSEQKSARSARGISLEQFNKRASSLTESRTTTFTSKIHTLDNQNINNKRVSIRAGTRIHRPVENNQNKREPHNNRGRGQISRQNGPGLKQVNDDYGLGMPSEFEKMKEVSKEKIVIEQKNGVKISRPRFSAPRNQVRNLSQPQTSRVQNHQPQSNNQNQRRFNEYGSQSREASRDSRAAEPRESLLAARRRASRDVRFIRRRDENIPHQERSPGVKESKKMRKSEVKVRVSETNKRRDTGRRVMVHSIELQGSNRKSTQNEEMRSHQKSLKPNQRAHRGRPKNEVVSLSKNSRIINASSHFQSVSSRGLSIEDYNRKINRSVGKVSLKSLYTNRGRQNRNNINRKRPRTSAHWQMPTQTPNPNTKQYNSFNKKDSRARDQKETYYSQIKNQIRGEDNDTTFSIRQHDQTQNSINQNSKTDRESSWKTRSGRRIKTGAEIKQSIRSGGFRVTKNDFERTSRSIGSKSDRSIKHKIKYRSRSRKKGLEPIDVYYQRIERESRIKDSNQFRRNGQGLEKVLNHLKRISKKNRRGQESEWKNQPRGTNQTSEFKNYEQSRGRFEGQRGWSQQKEINTNIKNSYMKRSYGSIVRSGDERLSSQGYYIRQSSIARRRASPSENRDNYYHTRNNNQEIKSRLKDRGNIGQHETPAKQIPGARSSMNRDRLSNNKRTSLIVREQRQPFSGRKVRVEGQKREYLSVEHRRTRRISKKQLEDLQASRNSKVMEPSCRPNPSNYGAQGEYGMINPPNTAVKKNISGNYRKYLGSKDEIKEQKKSEFIQRSGVMKRNGQNKNNRVQGRSSSQPVNHEFGRNLKRNDSECEEVEEFFGVDDQEHANQIDNFDGKFYVKKNLKSKRPADINLQQNNKSNQNQNKKNMGHGLMRNDSCVQEEESESFGFNKNRFNHIDNFDGKFYVNRAASEYQTGRPFDKRRNNVNIKKCEEEEDFGTGMGQMFRQRKEQANHRELDVDYVDRRGVSGKRTWNRRNQVRVGGGCKSSIRGRKQTPRAVNQYQSNYSRAFKPAYKKKQYSNRVIDTRRYINRKSPQPQTQKDTDEDENKVYNDVIVIGKEFDRKTPGEYNEGLDEEEEMGRTNYEEYNNNNNNQTRDRKQRESEEVVYQDTIIMGKEFDRQAPGEYNEMLDEEPELGRFKMNKKKQVNVGRGVNNKSPNQNRTEHRKYYSSNQNRSGSRNYKKITIAGRRRYNQNSTNQPRKIQTDRRHRPSPYGNTNRAPSNKPNPVPIRGQNKEPIFIERIEVNREDEVDEGEYDPNFDQEEELGPGGEYIKRPYQNPRPPMPPKQPIRRSPEHKETSHRRFNINKKRISPQPRIIRRSRAETASPDSKRVRLVKNLTTNNNTTQNRRIIRRQPQSNRYQKRKIEESKREESEEEKVYYDTLNTGRDDEKNSDEYDSAKHEEPELGPQDNWNPIPINKIQNNQQRRNIQQIWNANPKHADRIIRKEKEPGMHRQNSFNPDKFKENSNRFDSFGPQHINNNRNNNNHNNNNSNSRQGSSLHPSGAINSHYSFGHGNFNQSRDRRIPSNPSIQNSFKPQDSNISFQQNSRFNSFGHGLNNSNRAGSFGGTESGFRFQQGSQQSTKRQNIFTTSSSSQRNPKNMQQSSPGKSGTRNNNFSTGHAKVKVGSGLESLEEMVECVEVPTRNGVDTDDYNARREEKGPLNGTYRSNVRRYGSTNNRNNKNNKNGRAMWANQSKESPYYVTSNQHELSKKFDEEKKVQFKEPQVSDVFNGESSLKRDIGYHK